MRTAPNPLPRGTVPRWSNSIKISLCLSFTLSLHEKMQRLGQKEKKKKQPTVAALSGNLVLQQ